MTDAPPPEVAAAAAVVDAWLKGNAGTGIATVSQPRPISATERFRTFSPEDRAKPQPAWKDPRTG
jgi:hypothetical protein